MMIGRIAKITPKITSALRIWTHQGSIEADARRRRSCPGSTSISGSVSALADSIGDALGQEGAPGGHAGAHRRRLAPSAGFRSGSRSTSSPSLDPEPLGILGRQLHLLRRRSGTAAPARSRPRAPPRSGGRCRARALRWPDARPAGSGAALGVGSQRSGGRAIGVAACGALGPADAVPGDLLQRQALVQRHRRRPAARTRRRRARRRGRSAAAAGELGQHRPAGTDLARVRDRDPQALQAAVGWTTRALLLGVGLGGEDHGGVLVAAPRSAPRRGRRRARRECSARSHRARSGWSRIGSVPNRYSAVSSPAAAARRSPRRRARPGRGRVARVRRRERTRPRAGPRPLAPAGICEQPGPGSSPGSAAAAIRSSAGGAGGADPLAVDDHDVLAAVAQLRGQRGDRLARRPRSPSSARCSARRPAPRRRRARSAR